MVRAADSISANLAESAGRFSWADRRRLLIIARGSASELEHWLDRANARALPTPAGATNEAQEISRMLNGLIRRLREP